MTIINSVIQGTGGGQSGGDTVTAYVPEGTDVAQGNKVLLNPAVGYASGDYWPDAAPFVPVRTFFSRETTQFISGSGIWDVADGELKQVDTIPDTYVRAKLYNQSYYTNNLIGFVPVNGKIKFILNSSGIITRHDNGTWSFKAYYDIDTAFESGNRWTYACESRFGGVVIARQYGYSGNAINGAFLKLTVSAYDTLVVERYIVGSYGPRIGCILSETSFIGYDALYTLTDDGYTTKSVESFYKTCYDEENGYIYGRSDPNGSNYDLIRYDFDPETGTLSNKTTFSGVLKNSYALATNRVGDVLYFAGCNAFGGFDLNTQSIVSEIVLPNGVKITMDALSYGEKTYYMNPINKGQQNATFVYGCYAPHAWSSSSYVHSGYIDEHNALIHAMEAKSGYGDQIYAYYGTKTDGVYSLKTGGSQCFYGSGNDIVFGPDYKTYYFENGTLAAWGGSYTTGSTVSAYELNYRVIDNQYVIDDFRGSGGPTFRQMDKSARTLEDLHSFGRWYSSAVLLAYREENTLVAYNALISANGTPGLYRDTYDLDTKTASATRFNSVTYPQGRTVQTSDNKYAFIFAADGIYAYYENEEKTGLVKDSVMSAALSEKLSDFTFRAAQSLPNNDIYVITQTGDYLFHINTDDGTVTQKPAPFGNVSASAVMLGGYYNAAQDVAMVNTANFGVLIRRFNPVLQVWETDTPVAEKFGGYSLTGIVDGDMEQDVLGNTVVSVKTVLDRNNIPSVDYDSVSGFACVVTDPSFEVGKGLFYDNQVPKVLAQPLNKTLAAFESGDGNGSAVGTVAEFMRLYTVAGADLTDVDIVTCADQTDGDPEMPTGYTTFRQLDGLIAANTYTNAAKRVFRSWTPMSEGLAQTITYGYVCTYETVGSPTIEAGAASNFSDSDYVTIPSYLTSSMTSFEVVIPFMTNDTSISNAGIIDTFSSPGHNFRLTVTSAGKLCFRFSTSGSSTSYAVNITGSTVLSTGTKYWAKVTYDSQSGYKLFLSSDGVSYTQEASSTTTSRPYYASGITWIIGDNTADGYSLDGVVYLDGVSVTIDGVLVWKHGATIGGEIGVATGYINQNNESYWYVDDDATLTLDNDTVGDKAYEMGVWFVKSADFGGVAPKLAAAAPTGYDDTLALEGSTFYLSEDKSYITTPPDGIAVSAIIGRSEETLWEQPVLSENGTVDGDSFAVWTNAGYYSSYYPYKPFASSTSYGWLSSSSSVSASNPAYYGMYFPETACLTQIVQLNRSDGSSETLGDFTVEASNDNDTWVTLATFSNRTYTAGTQLTFDLSDNVSFYRYYRLNITSNAAGSSGRVSVGMLTLTATLPATNGQIALSTGWQLSADKQIAFYVTENTSKTFEELTDGTEKAAQMELWLTKTADGVTDFKLYPSEPDGFAGVKKLADVTLSDDLSMIAEVTSV